MQDIIGTQLAGALDVFGAQNDMLTLLAGADAASPFQGNALAQAIALKGTAAAVVNRGATKARKYTQGFGPTVIAAGATVNIIVQPQVTFKGKRLVIPSDFAGAILLNDLKIGNISQLPSSNPIPGRMFTETAVDVEQDFDTAQISQQISLSVTNTSGASVNFSAGLSGIVVA